MDNSQAPSDRVRDLRVWLVELTENLEDTEVPALRDTPANTSQDSDSERPVGVVLRGARCWCSLPERQICEICKRTKITRTVRATCYLDQNGIEIKVPSMLRNGSFSWIVISRGPNRHVDEALART